MRTKMIDLISDTVTRPSEGMKRAMMMAPLGDDVFGEDPTVQALEEKLAEIFGHEAGLFCPSGTMTNQIAIQVHTRPGDAVICHEDAHIYQYEGGGIARNSGCSVNLLKGRFGMFKAADVEANIHPDHDYKSRTRLVAVEDTMNRGGGTCWDIEELKSISSLCAERGLSYHLDGARVFNALVAKQHDPIEYGRLFDTISICLSKGLGAPVGSVLIGSKEFIHESRRVRKVMGGGMRQAGIIAAAGIYALEHHVRDLSIDHQHAQMIAESLKGCADVLEVRPVETNIVIAEMESNEVESALLEEMESAGIRAISMGDRLLRWVTHRDVNEGDIQQVCALLDSRKSKSL